MSNKLFRAELKVCFRVAVIFFKCYMSVVVVVVVAAVFVLFVE